MPSGILLDYTPPSCMSPLRCTFSEQPFSSPAGGTYTQDVAKYCAYGFRAEKVAENTWKVVEVALGDVNGDGSVDVADVVLLRRYIVGLVDETKINVFAANVYSEDNDINVLDVVLIRQIIVRQPTTEENN